jgi:hypothetical protein
VKFSASDRDHPAIFPSSEFFTNAEVYLPLSQVGEEKYEEIFDSFLAQIQ